MKKIEIPDVELLKKELDQLRHIERRPVGFLFQTY